MQLADRLADRIALYARWWEAAGRAGVGPTAFLVRRLGTARYRLGTSEADLVIPYAIGEDLRRLFQRALDELLNLYVSRNRDRLGDAVYDTVLLASEGGTVSLRPPAYAPPSTVRSHAMRAAMAAAARFLPGLDAGVLASWWGEEGAGRRLLRAWIPLAERAVEEGREAGEDTPLLLHWMLAPCFGEARRLVTELRLPTRPSRELGAALLLGLELTQRVVLAAAAGGGPPPLAWAVVANPQVTFHSWPETLDHCRTLPLLPDDLVALEREVGPVVRREGPLAARSAVAAAGRTRGTRRLVVAAACRAELLDRVYAALAAVRAPEIQKALLAFAWEPGALEAASAERQARRELLRQIDGWAAACDGPAAQCLVVLAEWLDRYRPQRPDPALAGGLDAAVARAADALAVAQGDRLAADAASPSLAALQRRTGKETDRDLEHEYARGRLYRLSAQGEPLHLGSGLARSAEVAHLFTDMKDFTLRTAELKEEAMADFLRRNFYEPILALARRHYTGLVDLDDRGGIHLNNLLGDAVSVSGDVVALLTLAREIRRHLRTYARELRERLTAAGEAALAAAELSAGTFISFGPAPTVLRFEDPVWGELRVAIAEKINESARGTGRSAAVRQLVEAMLEEARERSGRPALQLPFRVYVSGSIGLPISAGEELAIRRALESGRGDEALAVYRERARRFVHETTEGGREAVRRRIAEASAIYNAGEALSREALRAYQETVGRGHFYVAQLRTSELPGELTEAFAFFEPVLTLVVHLGEGGAVVDLFRFAGRVTFKGMEAAGPLEVWELLDSEGPVAQRLARSEALQRALTPMDRG
ncbi:MAG: hypothetical protein D6729_08540 [Deltaproteobacteria bacterium]|nr:MAG: hypothetical protein D6729_08540 [Deltaproteobacteria bacterium]